MNYTSQRDSYLSDVNENNVAVLIDGEEYLLETGMENLVLGYYRRKRVQEKYDELYGFSAELRGE